MLRNINLVGEGRAADCAQIDVYDQMILNGVRFGDSPRARELDRVTLAVLKGDCIDLEPFSQSYGKRSGRIQPSAQQHNRFFPQGHTKTALQRQSRIARLLIQPGIPDDSCLPRGLARVIVFLRATR